MNINEHFDQLEDAIQEADPQHGMRIAFRAAMSNFPSANFGGTSDFSEHTLFPLMRLMLATIVHIEFDNAVTRVALDEATTAQPKIYSQSNGLTEHRLASGVLIQSRDLVHETLCATLTNSATRAGSVGGLSDPQAYDVRFLALSDWIISNLTLDTFSVHSTPLYTDKLIAPPLDFFTETLHAYFTQSPYSFWREWYQGFLDGKPLDWELQRRVALIPDDDWEKGPEHIAEKIQEIKAEYLAAQLPLAEDLEFDQDSGTFHTVPREMAKPDLLGATLSQVEDALDDVMENYSNGINERSVECRKLTRTFRKYGNDPQRIEMDFTTVHAGLTRQIINGELPPSEENLALQSALEEGAKAVRATHPEVAENRRILQEQNLRELTDDEKATLEEALPVLQAISDEALAEEWAQDIPALTNDSLLPVPDSAPRLPGADEATRIFGRAARMAVETKKSESIVQRIDGHSGYKALRIIQVLEWLVQLGMRILMYF